MVAQMARLGLALVLAALALPATSDAAVPEVWATVNVCDTAKHPNTIGIRASMPGAQRTSVRLYMRFRIEWKDPNDGLWHNTIGFGDSGFVNIGRPKDGGRRQAGYVFPLKKPAKPLRLRGKVDFEWRIAKKVVRRERVRTAKGHRSGAGSDPKGYSAATCLLR
jgi:hypothetical protein